MSDDRLELPLFDQPGIDRPGVDRSGVDRSGVDQTGGDRPAGALPDDEPPTEELPVVDATDSTSEDQPIVVETLEIPAVDEPDTFPIDQIRPAGVGSRLAAGLIDLLVHVALAGILIGGSALLEAPIGWRHIVPLAFVGGIFSFVYHVIPLAFWGRTPGMAVAGLRARTLEDQPLSLQQATKHWLALALTVATAGLGVLLALGGRSLADRLSGSQTLSD